MIIKHWDKLPDNMKNESVREYYEVLSKKSIQLIFKRIFDITLAAILLIILSPLLLIIAVIIKLDSKGPAIYRQTRVTQYGKEFRICKFRTMIPSADTIGTQVTTKNDMRITKIGRILRKYRLDEIPQLFNIIIKGDMTFVGTRPEVPRYVKHYTNEMMATLLLPAGITSEASIKYKDEESLLANASAEDIEVIYTQEVLPEKMNYNLRAIKGFSFVNDIKVIFKTGIAMVWRNKE